MSENRPTTLLLVDDHRVVREGLATLLAREAGISVVGQAASGEEAVRFCARESPDVVLLDLRMPGMGGVEATAQICRACPATRVLVLTTYHGDEDVYRAFKAGARGYILKSSGFPDVLRAVRAVAAGARVIPPEVASQLADRLGSEELTPRELEILPWMARGLSNKEIGGQLGVGEGTVKTFVRSILGKLGASDRTEAVTTALRRGILRLDE